MGNLAEFRRRFAFDPNKALYLGVEREYFVTDQAGKIVPKAPELLSFLHSPHSDPIDPLGVFGYELSACQVESHAGPRSTLEALVSDLRRGEEALDRGLAALGLGVSYTEVAPADMPLDVYPDPTGRYQEITRTMPRNILLGACRIIGTHVHIGMPDHETALHVYNSIVPEVPRLCGSAYSTPERQQIYREVAVRCDPPAYESWEAFHFHALQHGFEEDPRRCWTLARISGHGTLEFRMFGATADIHRVAAWASECRALCVDAMDMVDA
jgi:gamma-glutamyl:cysteine ligase YbdK (ATP-grasp superfamily)